MRKCLILLCLFVAADRLSAQQSDPYFKKVSIPADLENMAREFLQSSCTRLDLLCYEGRSGTIIRGEKFTFYVPSKYTRQESRPTQYSSTESYTAQEKVYSRSGESFSYQDVQRTRPVTVFDTTTSTVLNSQMERVGQKLEYQKKYSNSLSEIEKYKGLDNGRLVADEKKEINSKYSNKAYKQYLDEQEAELKRLTSEWKAVPLSDKDIKAQTIRVRSSWKNFKQEKATALALLESQRQALLEAKRFVYKYENDIP